jgi:hypothetical protein
LSSAKKEKNVSSFNQNTAFPRRERFNSDPHTKPLVDYTSHSNEQVIIDPKQVSYSLKSKFFKFIFTHFPFFSKLVDHKYSTREMVEYFEKISELLGTNLPKFKLHVDEVCDSKAKVLCSVNQRKSPFEGAKDRSRTFCSGYEFQSALNGHAQEKVFVPRNNPLQDIKINASVNK